MSNKLLQEAIVDADAIKEAAEKQAEQLMREKYASEFKDVYEQLLEQTPRGEEVSDLDVGDLEDDLEQVDAQDGSDDFDFDDDLDIAADDSMSKQIPYAHEDGEQMCPCPEEDEEIEIDFDELSAMMHDEEPMGREEMASDIMGDEDMFQESKETDEPVKEGCPPKEEPLEEKVVSDMNATQDGHMMTPTKELEYQLDKFISDKLHDKDEEESFKDKDYKKDLEEKDTEYDSLKEQYEILSRKNKELKSKLNVTLKEKKDIYSKSMKEIDKLKLMLEDASDKLLSINLSRAKLFYQNQTLSNNSLNERQKNKVVDAISSADSVKSAKTIFETLSKSVDANPKRNGRGKSLSEMLSKKKDFSLYVPRQEKGLLNEEKEDPRVKRMQKLAGLDKLINE